MSLTLAISPTGSLFWEEEEGSLPPTAVEKRLKDCVPVQGILLLAKEELGQELPAALEYWRDLGRLYLTRLCQTATDAREVSQPLPGELATLALEVPPMKGSEFLSPEILAALWHELDAHVQSEIQGLAGGRETFFHGSTWHQVGRVTFHLAENKKDPERPFAFLATYASGIGASSKLQHLPLGRAVQEYAGAKNKEVLLKLLQPVQAASAQSLLIKELVDSTQIYHPQAWTISQAYRFLKEIPILEQSGVLVRVPNWWKATSPSRPTVSIAVGSKKDSQVGADALLDFKVSLTLDGETITAEEWQKIAESSQGLAFLKGRWVEIDKAKLDEVLQHWKGIESNTKGIGFLQGMRLLAGANIDKSDEKYTDDESKGWTRFQAGPWLEEVLSEMRNPEKCAALQINGVVSPRSTFFKKSHFKAEFPS